MSQVSDHSQMFLCHLCCSGHLFPLKNLRPRSSPNHTHTESFVCLQNSRSCLQDREYTHSFRYHFHRFHVHSRRNFETNLIPQLKDTFPLRKDHIQSTHFCRCTCRLRNGHTTTNHLTLIFYRVRILGTLLSYLNQFRDYTFQDHTLCKHGEHSPPTH